MIIKSVEIEKFRAFKDVKLSLGRRITAIAGRNATQKTTLLGMIGQPFTISSKDNPMYGCKTIDGYNFRSQFREKFKLSPIHDVIGQHKWKLKFHKLIDGKDHYTVESISRKQRGKDTTLRFWNAEGRSRGTGYIQLPVYFLSLSRLFPIGESGKTKSVKLSLSDSELKYCIDNYRTILSVHQFGHNSSVGIEKASARSFAGVNDDVHDIFTNSAGEGNIVRIILAILSFKRLKEMPNSGYKGGILLIDELDATLYGYSQTKLVEYLSKAAEEYKIQIIFTTHSPIILRCINKYQRDERAQRGNDLPLSSYNYSMVHLEPYYGIDCARLIKARNIFTRSGLEETLNDLNLEVAVSRNKLNVYCEDVTATDFLKFILTRSLNVNFDNYMSFVDVSLGWPNYVHLAEKRVPEFTNSLIVLDGDVPSKREYVQKREIVETSGNFIFLPLVIEKDLFELLKNPATFSEFKDNYLSSSYFNYDICFKDWTLASCNYSTIDYKNWFEHLIEIVGQKDLLFEFWCMKHEEQTNQFKESFISLFNKLADKNGFDRLVTNDYSTHDMNVN